MKKKIAVIGAGIAGTTTAYSLAKQGLDVTLIDSRRYPAMATSYANGGQLSASNSEVWNTPKNIMNGVKWMFKKDAPLLFLSIERRFYLIHRQVYKNTNGSWGS